MGARTDEYRIYIFDCAKAQIRGRVYGAGSSPSTCTSSANTSGRNPDRNGRADPRPGGGCRVTISSTSASAATSEDNLSLNTHRPPLDPRSAEDMRSTR